MKVNRTSLITLAVLAVPSLAITSESSSFENDRTAILAMAGEFEVDFQFIETVAIKDGYEPKKPYFEDAAEMVFIVENSPKHIVLQHVLWVETHDRVVKHWKQEWKYENRILHEFVGDNTWKRRELTEDEARGTWTQKVWQVDDSPRYQSYGKWVHEGGMSSWQGNTTRRPLPRREYTKRKDYDTMMAINRHTLTPSGWVHEQDNYKKVTADGEVLCREVGLNRYFRTKDVDFTEVKNYWKKHSAYWAKVSGLWEKELRNAPKMALRDEVDGKPLFRQLFAVIKEEKKLDAQVSAAESVIRKFVIRSN